jgi:hypothetical protein
VVLVSGLIKARRLDRKAEEARVEKMRRTDPLSEQEFLRLTGGAPNLIQKKQPNSS